MRDTLHSLFQDIQLFAGGGGSIEATFVGDAGNNTINGTSADDFFNMNDGGDDTVNGLGGNDVFTFGAALNAADKVNGGTGTDSLVLNGNYGAGLTFLSTTVSSIEEMDLLGATNNYKLTMNDGNVAAGVAMVVSAAGLDAAHGLTFDGSTESNGFFNVIGGAGQDLITVRGAGNTVNGNGGNDILTVSNGAAGHDVLNGGAGNDFFNFTTLFNATDQIDGGIGTDTLNLNGDYSAGVTLGATTLLNVEAINLAAGHAYTLATNDATIAAGGHLLIDGSALFSTSNTMLISGAGETDGSFQIEAGAGNDVLTTGAGNDGIDGGTGDDTIAPGTGSDSVNAGIGNDIVNMAANLDATDLIDGGTGLNILNLQGDYSAGLVLQAGTIKNFQTINLKGDFSYALTFNDGNFSAAAAIKDGGQTVGDSITLDASAEISAALTLTFAGPEQLHITLGGGNDTVTVAKAMSSGDSFDGGGSFDALHFTGGGTGGFGPGTIQNFSTLTFEGASDYHIGLGDQIFAAGTTGQIWDGGQAAGSTLEINASGEVDAQISFKFTGNETRIITGGELNDAFSVFGTLKATDQLEGGGGTQNSITLDGDYSAGLTLAADTLHDITMLHVQSGHDYKLVTNDGNFYGGQEVFVSTQAGFANKLSFDGSAETDAYFNITGGAGNDALVGGALGDIITTGAGVDQIQGGGGDDTIEMLNGAYTFADGVSGGTGVDTLIISGDYTAGVTLGGNVGVEKVEVLDGNDYKFTTTNTFVAAGQTVGISGGFLTGPHKLILDGSAETNGNFQVFTGTGDDVVTTGTGDDQMSFTTGTETANGGAGNDSFFFLSGGFDAGDTLDGGAGGSDMLVLGGGTASTIVFGPSTIQNIEIIQVLDGASYQLATDDANIAAGATLLVDATQLSDPNALDFDGTAELDGMFVLKGGAAGDGLIGGGGADQIFGNGGNDEISGFGGDDFLDGGPGFDQIDGGEGNDTIDVSQGTGSMVTGWNGDDTTIAGTAFYTAITVDGGAGTDTVEVSGDYSAGYTFDESAMTNVETFVVSDNAFNDKFTTVDFTVAAGQNLTVDGTAMGPAFGLTLNGSAETDGTFLFLAGSGADVLTGGAMADTFDLSRGGDDTANGGGSNDLFLMGAALTAADKILGAGNTDTVALDGNYAAGLVLGATTLTSIEVMTFGPRFSYNLTMNDGNVGAGKTLKMDGSHLNVDHWLKIDGSAESNGRFVMLGGDGSDTLAGGAGADSLQGGRGADHLTGGVGADVFVYKSALESSGAGYDTITGLDFSSDTIDVNKVTGIDAAITTGSLSMASFDTDMAAQFTPAHLLKHHAALFTADAGDLAGHTFLVVDANGNAGYQAGGDYVFDVTGATGTLTLADFV
jgi:Ca2+-binding RTX toxin-like protein